MMKKSKKTSKIAQAILNEVAPDTRGYDSDGDDVTSAKVVAEQDDELNGDDTWDLDFEEPKRSDLRAKNAKILADFDSRYKGKKISRKSLLKDRGDVIDSKEQENADLGFMFEAESGEEKGESDDQDSDEEDEKDEKSFEFERGSDVDYGAFGGDSDEAEDSGDSENELKGDSDGESEENEDNAENPILKNNLQSEVEKGLAIKQQLSEWDSLFESRIQIQKCLTKINQYPEYDHWQALFSTASEGSDDIDLKIVKKAQTSLANLLDSLLEARVNLINQNSELSEILRTSKRSHSDSEDDNENEDDQDVDFKAPSKKLKLRQYEDILSQQHSSLKLYRDKTIEKWNDKTRLSTGHLKSKSFAGFESSTLQQIEHILADKSRLVKRTQLKRSNYTKVGTKTASVNGDTAEDYDPEIFDDDDFYHQLLRELIERKTDDTSDPHVLGQQWLQVQRMRSKMKRKVDTKASKGRKTRFDIHAKLVNFMAPVYHETLLTDEARTELYKSLFGKTSK